MQFARHSPTWLEGSLRDCATPTTTLSTEHLCHWQNLDPFSPTTIHQNG